MEDDEDETIIECAPEESNSSRNQARTPASAATKDQRITKNEWLEFEKNLPEIVIDPLGISSYKQAYEKAMEIIPCQEKNETGVLGTEPAVTAQ